MKDRCPAAVPVGRAVLADFRPVFRRWIDVEPETGARAEGALWRVTPDCLLSLDDYEEVETDLYRRAVMAVATEAGGLVEALVYRMTAATFAPPDPAHLADVLQGCRDFSIDPKPILDAARAASR